MSQTPLQTIIDPGTDPTLSIYATNAQNVPVISSANVVITNTNQYITEIYNLKATAAGNVGELEFNDGSGFAGDTGLTYNAESDSLTVTGNVFAGNIRTDNLKYANGTSYVFGANYSNSNVASYLPTYNGTITGGTIVSSGNSNAAVFNGSGAGLTNLPAANIVGNIPNAAFATTAGTANTVAGANVTGTVANATFATTAGAVAGANVTGTVANATTAGTVTTTSQPNISSVGTLSSLTVSGNISVGNLSTSGNASVSRINVTTTANLGLVGNVTITGGTSGQYLQTNGLGVLSWATVAGASTPTLQQVTTANAETSDDVVFTSNTASIGYSSGAVKISGGLGVAGNIHIGDHVTAINTIFAGQYSDLSSFTVPKFVGRDAGAAYIQGALVNTNENGSSDWVAYGDTSDDANGWTDMGFTGSAFNDTTYTITKENDGYIFVQGMPTTGGNLVIATGDKGGATHRDIVFATGGFLITDEKMRLNHEDSTFYVGAHGEAGGTTVVNLDTNGNLTVDGNFTIGGNITAISASPAPNMSGFNSVSAVNLTGTLTTNAQPNITSLGEMSGITVRGITDLGGISNVKITGGTSGQVLSTDGTGNLSFATPSSSYNDSNVVTLLGSFGSNTISTTGNVSTGNVAVTGSLTSTGKIGYTSGSTVTQTTNRGNGVAINTLAGTIITTSVAMVATEIDTFTVVNSSVDPNNDIVLAQIVSPNQGTYNCIANPAVIGGFDNGFVLSIHNISGFTTSDETITIRFMVIKAPNA